MNKQMYQTYLQILQKELVPAMGCTEPIAIALTASWQAMSDSLPRTAWQKPTARSSALC